MKKYPKFNFWLKQSDVPHKCPKTSILSESYKYPKESLAFEVASLTIDNPQKD